MVLINTSVIKIKILLGAIKLLSSLFGNIHPKLISEHLVGYNIHFCLHLLGVSLLQTLVSNIQFIILANLMEQYFNLL